MKALLLLSVYCKTLYFRCILISQFSYVKNLLHFNLAYFPVKLFYAYKVMVMGKFQKFTLFNFVILFKPRKFGACEIWCFTIA